MVVGLPADTRVQMLASSSLEQPSSPWAPYGSKGHPDHTSFRQCLCCSTADGPVPAFLVAVAHMPGQIGLGSDTLLEYQAPLLPEPEHLSLASHGECSHNSTEKNYWTTGLPERG